MNHPLKRWSVPSGALGNLRDVGGLACEGGVTRYGRLLRADMLTNLKHEDVEYLLGKGLCAVIDLRSRKEIEFFPNSFAQCPGVSMYMPNATGDTFYGERSAKAEREHNNMGAHYMDLADTWGTLYAQCVRAVADAPGLAVVHCVAGKDRTGTAIALIEMLLGVEDDDIIADYQVSHTFNRRLRELYAFDHDTQTPAYVHRSDPECIAAFIGYIREEYGGAYDYLAAEGINEGDVLRLRAALVEPV